ncbi:bifunctional phosphopantothenoylcysteine decarboxylase/phosphopantothenate--cysteine ligase CoaBC [Humibacter sp.]|uniref:bifunctional phosphopantothenoylcysteine decarboxylase/phosphopantothenate--cysteine ligase CoaBC n=1 Tax=Humibacter sp. TaxID=1940291 RepID=UPI003F7F4AA0
MTIVVGVTGGIAAYKAVSVIRSFVLLGHDVHVIATDAALRFVGAPTFEAISRNPLNTDLYEGVSEVRHVGIGKRADLVVIAPATANTIAKLANGLADDLLTNTVLATEAPVLIAPAMHSEMWRHPATQANVQTLRLRGVAVVGPGVGQLTGSDSGPGRMEEPDAIVAAAMALAARQQGRRDRAGSAQDATRGRRDLAGHRIVITAGGTREPLDPVRFLGNRSSGKQGVAIAVAARDRGADVVLIAAHLDVPAPEGVETRTVSTALELQRAVTGAAADADVVVMAAAVADFRPESTSEAKIKKENVGDGLELSLVANPDILAELSATKQPDQIVVGFAAETERDPQALIELGKRKLQRKGCDYLVINNVGWHTGFSTDHNEVVVLDSGGDIVMEASGTKASVADRILDVITSA